MDAKRRPSGIEGLGDISWGTHFCLFYETREDLLEILIPYFKVGLANHEFCLCVASEPVIAEETKQALHEAVPGFKQYLSEGQIEIVSHMNWYLQDGHFDPLRVRQGWLEKLEQAQARGYAGMRFAANVSWLEQQNWNDFAEYEGKLDEVFRQSHMIGVCAYSVERCLAAGTLDVVRHHEFTLMRRDGTWESLEGTQLMGAREEVLKLNNELERRVIERTAELTSLNEQLRTEIIERMRVEEALRESEEKFSAAFRASPIALVIATLDGKFVEMNQAYCDLLGYPREELIGKTGIELGVFTKEARQEWIQTAERKGGVITNREFSFRALNGISRTVLSSVEKITFHGVSHFLSTILDITESKHAEEALRKSERVLREAEVLGHTGSWEQDLITGEIFNTEENLRLFFGDDRSKGDDFKDYAEVVHPDDREYVMQRRAELLEEEGPNDIEYRVVWPDGSVHVIFGRATVVRNELGQPIRVHGTNVDITERKRAEQEMKRQTARAETLARIAARLNQQLDLGTVVHAVCQEVVDTCKASQATMSLYDKKHDLLVYAGGVNIPPEYAAKIEPIRRTQFEGFVRTMDHILVIPDIQALPNVPNAEFSARFDVRTVVTVDVRRDKELIGVLALGVNGHVREFDQDELNLLKAISDQAAQAIANARLFQTVSEHATRMEALAEISRTFAEAGLDYQSILDTVARRTAEIIGDSCVITLFSDETQRSFPVAFHHPVPEAQALMQDALLHTWQGGTDSERYQILLAGHSIYIPTVNEEEFRVTLEPEFLPYLDAVGISSVLLVPLQFQSRVIGTTGITRDRHGKPYTREDLTLLQNIADQAAMSIQNAQLFRQVEGAREQLGALSKRLLEVQESERRALTTELHDRVGQNLTGLSILLQNMKALLTNKTVQKLATRFDDAQALVEDTTRQIRDIMAELHLPELEDYGLAAALETYAERIASRGSLKLITDLPDLASPPLPSDVRVALFRAAQEAISNVLKHAGATQLEISLEGRDGRIRLKVEDDGTGFEPEVASQRESPSWGLKIMRERIESIGGNVQIESASGKGTQVIFEIERPS